MRWRDRRQSTNVEDRRTMGGRRLAVGSGIGGIVVLILYLLLGGNLGDETVYIDLGFFADMQQRLNAPGDFAMAYVITHEVGHHVQNQLGLMDQVMSLSSSRD